MAANMNPKKNPMPTQAPEVRARNFEEVALGYDRDTAIDEALRCLNCKNMPCVTGCPVNIHIPAFIEKIKEGDFEEYVVACREVGFTVDVTKTDSVFSILSIQKLFSS